MAKWRGTATVVWYFDAPDKDAAENLLDVELSCIEGGYRDIDIEEIEEEEFRREAKSE